MSFVKTYYRKTKMALVQAHHGELELWKAFWVMGILGHFSVFVIKALMVALWPGLGGQIGYGIVFAFSTYWLYVLWRCAMNVEMLIWFFIVRMYAVLAFVVLVLKFFKVFFV